MKKILQKIESTFDTYSKGYSARKLTAFVFCILTIYLCIKHTTEANLYDVLIILLTFILLCFGMITFQDIIKFKNGTTDNTPNANGSELQGDKDKAE